MNRDSQIVELFKDINSDTDMSLLTAELYAKMDLIDKMKASNERLFRFRRLAFWCVFASGMILCAALLADYYFVKSDSISIFWSEILGGGPIWDMVLSLERYSDWFVPIVASNLFVITSLPLLNCLLWTARYEYPPHLG